MKNIMKIRFLCLLLSASMAVLFTGCSRKQVASVTKPFDTAAAATEATDSVMVQNDRFILRWEDKTKGISLTEKATGNVWGTSPKEPAEVKLDEWGDPIRRHPQVDSVLFVNYIAAETGILDMAMSNIGAVQNGRVRYSQKENSIRAEYYFDEVGFMIPVEYTLREDSVLLTIEPTEIQESENTIVSVSLAPFWCAAENDLAESYLFVPSGSGALVYPKTASQQGTNYSAQVYGEDPAIEIWDQPVTEQPVRLPVYGAKTGNTAALAVIESGAECAELNVTYGSRALGYSSVYAAFQLRGYTNNIADMMPGERVKNLIYTDDIHTNRLSVGFYPLTQEQAGYSGMASRYRAYLQDNEKLQKKGIDSSLNLNIIGGAMVSKSFLGVPYQTIFPATTTDEALEIIKELEGQGLKPLVRLSGFGENGISTGKLAGGFGISSKLGGKSGINRLADYCSQQGIETYLDFDLIRFAKGSAGFSALFDSAQCASHKIAYQYDFDITTRGRNADSRYRLLARNKLVQCAETLRDKTAGLNMTGYSLGTLSSTAYSDYSDRTSCYGYCKGDMAEDTARIFANMGRKVMASDANAYAAAQADVIFHAPLSSAQHDIFDEDIPFYEMVWKGMVPMACESLNLAPNADRLLLKAVESGCGLTYTVVKNYDKALLDVQTKEFYNSVFDDVRDVIIQNAKQLAEYYEKTNGAVIAKHSILANGLRLTEFDNGTAVYVNFGDAEADTPFGTVPAGGYVTGGSSHAEE